MAGKTCPANVISVCSASGEICPLAQTALFIQGRAAYKTGLRNIRRPVFLRCYACFQAKTALWKTFLPFRILTPSFSISSVTAN